MRRRKAAFPIMKVTTTVVLDRKKHGFCLYKALLPVKLARKQSCTAGRRALWADGRFWSKKTLKTRFLTGLYPTVRVYRFADILPDFFLSSEPEDENALQKNAKRKKNGKWETAN